MLQRGERLGEGDEIPKHIAYIPEYFDFKARCRRFGQETWRRAATARIEVLRGFSKSAEALVDAV